MQVSIETLEGLERKMTVQIPVDTVSQAVEKKLRDLSKTVRIDGFRPGKVPLKVVKQKYGVHVRQEVLGDVIESSYRDAITQENIRPAGMPSIESVDSEGNEDVSYTAVFEVYPEVENLKLDSIKVEQKISGFERTSKLFRINFLSLRLVQGSAFNGYRLLKLRTADQKTAKRSYRHARQLKVSKAVESINNRG